MNVLIVGRLYNIDTYCEYLMNLACDESSQVYLITGNEEENYIEKAIVINDEEEFDKVIKTIDQVYVFDDGFIPEKIKNKIEINKSKSMKIININLKEYAESNEKYVQGKEPTVLLLYDGTFSQYGKLELQLNKEFKENSVKIYHSLSPELKMIINSLDDKISANFKELFQHSEPVDLKLITFDVADVFRDFNMKFYDLLKNTKPDFIVYCMEAKHAKLPTKIEILKYRYAVFPDVFVESNYANFENAYGQYLHCKNDLTITKDNKIMKMNSNVGKIIVEKIISKLYLPIEIKRVV